MVGVDGLIPRTLGSCIILNKEWPLGVMGSGCTTHTMLVYCVGLVIQYIKLNDGWPQGVAGKGCDVFYFLIICFRSYERPLKQKCTNDKLIKFRNINNNLN